jgi:hypothetical protein
MKMKCCLGLLLLCLLQLPAFSQEKDTAKKSEHWVRMVFGEYPRDRKGVYASWGGDGGILSFADMRNNGEHVRNIPRFTVFANVGTNFNYNFNNSFGIFSGLNIKNIGLISKENDSLKLKRRVYTLGIPIGFKIGDVKRGNFFFFAGGSYDLAFNYKEKQFINGDKRHKFNEWFSDRTPLLMPSVFAGLRFYPGFGLKVQYYLKDFFNREYSETVNGVKQLPYRNLEGKLFFVTINYDFGRVDYHRDRHHHRRK